MNQGSVNFKVFLYKNGSKIDCRRIGIDAIVSASFVYLKEKLETVFPTLRDEPYNISWMDSDDDAITIMSDEELITAITDMTGPVKALHVNISGNTPDLMCEVQVDVPTTVVCDGCDKTITHSRYKCLQCPDYDLCANCEQKGHHSDHIMLRSPQPALPNCIPKLMVCLSRSIHRTQMHAAREIFKADRQNRGNHSFSTFGRNGRGRHDKGKRECAFGDIPLLLNFEKLSSSLLSTFDNITNPSNGNRNATEPATNNTQNQTQGPDAANPAAANNTQNQTPGPVVDNPAAAPCAQNITSQPNTTPQSSSGFVTPNNEQMYPNVPMETEPEAKSRENDWTFVLPQAPTEPAPSAPVQQPKSNIVQGLEQLLDIGFKNEELLVSLLKKYDGDVSLVIRDLLDNGK